MSVHTNVEAPVYFARSLLGEALSYLARGDEVNALSRLDSVISEADLAITRVDDAFDPASLVLTAARHGAMTARAAVMLGNTSEAAGATRTALAILDNVPILIEAHLR